MTDEIKIMRDDLLCKAKSDVHGAIERTGMLMPDFGSAVGVCLVGAAEAVSMLATGLVIIDVREEDPEADLTQLEGQEMKPVEVLRAAMHVVGHLGDIPLPKIEALVAEFLPALDRVIEESRAEETQAT